MNVLEVPVLRLCVCCFFDGTQALKVLGCCVTMTHVRSKDIPFACRCRNMPELDNTRQHSATSVLAVTSLGDNRRTSWALHECAGLAIPLKAQTLTLNPKPGSAAVAVCLKHAEALGTLSYFELERASPTAAAVVKWAAHDAQIS